MVFNMVIIEDKVNVVDDIFGEFEVVFEFDDSNVFLNIDNLLFVIKKYVGLNEEYV